MSTEKFILTEEMIDAYNSIKSKRNTAILGSAGTGKSSFISYLINNGMKIVKLAPTGVSAFNIGGSTTHKFFGFPPRTIESNKVPEIKDWAKLNILFNADAILIDEISMVRSDMMDGIDSALKKTLKNDLYFGGLTMIFMGDLGQLSPVVSQSAEREYFKYNYKSEFFFDSTVFTQMESDAAVNYFNFTKIFRQTDPVFISYLNKVRFGVITHREIDEINDICFGKPNNKEIVICSRNMDVKIYNDRNMYDLDTPLESFVATITGDFKVEHCNVDEVIELKVGARVMTLINKYIE